MSDYEGARFWKSDLQVQTPEDSRRWQGQASLRQPRTEADLQEKARLFLERCHEVDLEVIAVTDHNFSSRDNDREWFLTHLLQQNGFVAERLQRKPLIIFPGFELDIGFHVLCIFNPSTRLHDVSACLTTMGLPAASRYANGQPQPCRFEGRAVSFETVLQVVQDGSGGIVIAPHAFSTKGIADAARDAAEYRDERLLAIEGPQFPLPSGRANDIWTGMPGWQRRRRPAVVSSSDSRRLRPSADDSTHYIGYRHTWIKMSKPSIESLRQAFLDPGSRLRFGADRPEDLEVHPRICVVSVAGARFFGDSEVHLSANLTSIIGGRGSGKSTLIEYLRQVLGQSDGIWGEEAQRNFGRLQQTITPETHIRVVIEKEGQRWVLESVGRASAAFVEGPSAPPEIARFFPVKVLSQREVYALAEDRTARGRLVDDTIRDELEALHVDESEVVLQARQLTTQLEVLPELARREAALATDEADALARLERLAPLEEPLAEWRRYLDAQHWFEELLVQAESVAEALGETVTTLQAVTFDEPPTDSPARNQLVAIQRVLAGGFASVREVATAAAAEFRDTMALAAEDASAEWRATFAEARGRFDSLREQLISEGTNPDGYLEYGQRLERVRGERAELLARRETLTQVANKRSALYERLRDIWRRGSVARMAAAERLTTSVPRTAGGQPFVTVTVEPFGDDRALAEALAGVVQDHRRIASDYWGEFDTRAGEIRPTDSFLACCFRAKPEGVSPIDVFLEWAAALRDGNQSVGCPWRPEDRRSRALVEWMTPQREANLRVLCVPDRTRVELRRPDGTIAGELEGGLSVGQRCTAVLALLLVADTTPIIIDQPEEDLDNEFVYRELVPLLRKVKARRQVIVSTHNANLPVNGDAELILALHAANGRGRVLKVGNDAAIGALDRRAVRISVEEVMEGSEEAFRRRSEMYGY